MNELSAKNVSPVLLKGPTYSLAAMAKPEDSSGKSKLQSGFDGIMMEMLKGMTKNEKFRYPAMDVGRKENS